MSKPDSEAETVEGLSVTESDVYARIPIPAKHPARSGLGGLQTALAAGQPSTGLSLLPSPIEEQVSHGAVVRKNTVIHEGSRVKSAEGLLNQWGSEEPVTPSHQEHERRASLETAESDSPAESPYIESAHARHMSAGSARLLDLPLRLGSHRSSMASFTAMAQGG